MLVRFAEAAQKLLHVGQHEAENNRINHGRHVKTSLHPNQKYVRIGWRVVLVLAPGGQNRVHVVGTVAKGEGGDDVDRDVLQFALGPHHRTRRFSPVTAH